MSDKDRRRQELVDGFGKAYQEALESLQTSMSPRGLLELYEHGLVSSQEILSECWSCFHNKPDAFEIAREELDRHPAQSIRNLPNAFDDLQSRRQ